MPNSPSEMIPDMSDWRQIWGSDRPRKGSESAETSSFLVRGTTSNGGLKGSTRNGRCDPKSPSSSHIRMVREDAGAPNEDATCAWMAADEAEGCTRAFLMMWRCSRRLACGRRLEPGLRVNDISRIHWSQHLLTTQSKRPN
ncbi:uncharacterized protein TNCV_2169651 [Trichonephila clavipes]|nr:uncharacterized protein TNCV_2169651 [Trichonephila clavipes]